MTVRSLVALAVTLMPLVGCPTKGRPEDRTDRHSRSIRVHVTIVRAPKHNPHDDPVLVTGWANQPNYGGIAPLAQRVRRDVIMVDTRGTGHSVPALDCPEVSPAVHHSLGNQDRR